MASTDSKADGKEAVERECRVSDQTEAVAPSAETGPAARKTDGRLKCEVRKLKRLNRGALVDRGANGGILGFDAKVIHTHKDQPVDVTGIDNHELSGLKLVDAVGVCESHKGPVVVLVGPVLVHMHQYAYYGRSRSIHSSGQVEHNKC